MDNTNESQEFDLDDILREFHEDPDDDVKDTASEEELDVDVLLVEEVSSPAPEQPEAPETAEAPEETPDPVSSGDTVRFDPRSTFQRSGGSRSQRRRQSHRRSDRRSAVGQRFRRPRTGSPSAAPDPAHHL